MVVECIVLRISLIVSIVNSVATQHFEGFVVGGVYAKMKDFPHAALLTIECRVNEYDRGYYTCGSSILNQGIVITVAHCLNNCLPEYTFVTVFVGKRMKMKGLPYVASSFKMHEKYEEESTINDIALVKLKYKLVFGENVRRVALMRKPPKYGRGKVAGWGFMDEEKTINTDYLMQISQKVRSWTDCMKEVGSALAMPEGTICGGDVDVSSYVARGDSGSGLIIDKYILVGVVSYKRPALSESVVVYTDVAYYYDWVQKTAKTLYCQS